MEIAIYFDYLCPWCWPVALEIEKLRAEMAGLISVVHHPFILRPSPDPDAKFSVYQVNHRRYASMLTGLPYDVPELGSKYPSSSLPALIASKWVELHHQRAFEKFDKALFSAFFEFSRDISDPNVLLEIGESCGISRGAMRRGLSNMRLARTIWQEHAIAKKSGICSVPAVRIGEQLLVGAATATVYRNAILRLSSAA